MNLRLKKGLHRPDALPDADDADGTGSTGATLHATRRSNVRFCRSSGDEGPSDVGWWAKFGPQDVTIDMRRCIKTSKVRFFFRT